MTRSRGRGPVASVLLLVAGLLVALSRLFDGDVPPPVDTAPRAETRREAPPARVPETPEAAPADLTDVGDAALQAQIGRVVESMDRTGRPPAGVAQGGRRGGPKGVFDNREGRLPRRAPGYYTETDVWPKQPGKSRGALRLVFGRDGEVFYTSDHYRTFVTVRGPTR